MNPYDTQAAKELLKQRAYRLMYLCFELASDPSAEEIIQEMEDRVNLKQLTK